MIGILIPIVIVAISSLVIWRSVDGFSVASNYLGRNLSDGVKGATINAIASSMPELFTTFFFLFFLNDLDGFSGGIGTTAGSAIFNAMIIPAAAILAAIYWGLTKKVHVSKKVILRDGIALIIAEYIFIVLLSGETLYWWHGAVLMGIYFVYIAYMFSTMSKGEMIHSDDYHAVILEKQGEKNKKPYAKSIASLDLEGVVINGRQLNNFNAWFLLILSTLVIALSCYFLVLACEWLGADTYHFPLLGELNGLDIPILFVALILASAASSVPDTIISMKDSRDGNYDDAVSNAMGSNMFDICFAMGFPLFLFTIINGPLTMSHEIVEQSGQLRVLLLLITIVAFFIFYLGKGMGKGKAYSLLFIYLLFVAYVVGEGFSTEFTAGISSVLDEILKAVSFF